MRVLSPDNKWIKSHESTHNGIVLRMLPQSLLNFVYIMIETKFLNVAHMVEVVNCTEKEGSNNLTCCHVEVLYNHNTSH